MKAELCKNKFKYAIELQGKTFILSCDKSKVCKFVVNTLYSDITRIIPITIDPEVIDDIKEFIKNRILKVENLSFDHNMDTYDYSGQNYSFCNHMENCYITTLKN